MAIKMRILYASGKKKINNIANEIKAHYELAFNSVDVIPPAYSCDKERIVILAVSGKGEPDDVLRRFCIELNKKKAQNVALFVDGDEKLANKLLEVLRTTGTNVIDNVKYVKIGLFGGKVTDDEKASIIDWAHSIVDSIQ